MLEPRTDGVINQTIQKVIASRKQMKISTASLFDLHVFAKGIQLIDMGTTKKVSPSRGAWERTGGTGGGGFRSAHILRGFPWPTGLIPHLPHMRWRYLIGALARSSH